MALTLFVGVGGFAKPRTKADMQSVAMRAINQQLSSAKRSLRKDMPKEIKRTENYSVIGYSNGGFAVVSNDDLAPALLGCSVSSSFNDKNENFAWWLEAVDEAVSEIVKSGKQKASSAPDPNVFPTQVGPLMTTRWEQETPYNNLCPTYSSGHSATGCVATALAQILKYHQYPEHGIGSSSVISANGQTVTANFYEDYYQWDLMLDDYKNGYTEEQATAVAVLMRDLGVAAKMNYKSPEQGSGANSDEAMNGLTTYFGFEGLQYVERIDYSETQWMNMIYSELSNNGPIFYGGYSQNGGHAFVLHGYRADGFVYVNWGWGGDSDGYYDISLLNPKSTSYSQLQDMVIGIKGEAKDLISDVITTTAGGQLVSKIDADKYDKLGELKIIGPLNNDDILLLNRLAGNNADGNGGQLYKLDLSEATLPSDALPAKAFFGSNRLVEVILPSSLKTIGDGAFGYCTKLKTVAFGNSADKQFAVEDNMIYSADETELICALPCVAGEISPKRGIVNIHPYAFAGCQMVSKLTLPASAESIGTEAFAGMLSMKEMRVAHQGVPTLSGEDVFKDVRTDQCKLYVRRGFKQDYSLADQWKVFEDITEYGTVIKATNVSRKYGEDNPKFGYKMTGDKVSGVPELRCDAMPNSSAGQYTIWALPGTITEEAVDYTNGTLNVKKIPLDVTLAQSTYTRFVGEPNPEFELSYSGFVLDDDVWSIDTPPTVSCEATEFSPAGEYIITLSGGYDDCYEVSANGSGVLIVTEPTGISNVLSDVELAEPADIYTISGQLVKHNAKSLNGLSKGVYMMDGKKIIIK